MSAPTDIIVIQAGDGGVYTFPGPGEAQQFEAAAAQAAVADSAEAAAENLQVQGAGLAVSQESLLGLTGTVNATPPTDTPARRGFLRQLLSRFSSGQG